MWQGQVESTRGKAKFGKGQSRFGRKSGACHRKILLLPADVLQADFRRTSMSVSVYIIILGDGVGASLEKNM